MPCKYSIAEKCFSIKCTLELNKLLLKCTSMTDEIYSTSKTKDTKNYRMYELLSKNVYAFVFVTDFGFEPYRNLPNISLIPSDMMNSKMIVRMTPDTSSSSVTGIAKYLTDHKQMENERIEERKIGISGTYPISPLCTDAYTNYIRGKKYVVNYLVPA